MQAEEWISIEEASLLMSIRDTDPNKSTYVSRQNIQQLRREQRFPQEALLTIATQTFYHAEAMRTYPIHNVVLYRSGTHRHTMAKHFIYKREWGPQTFTVEIIAYWLRRFPETIADLKSRGYSIPHEEAARQLLASNPDVRPIGRRQSGMERPQRTAKASTTPGIHRTHDEYPAAIKERGVQLYNEGLSFREITRRLNAEKGIQTTPQTVKNWVTKRLLHSTK